MLREELISLVMAHALRIMSLSPYMLPAVFLHALSHGPLSHSHLCGPVNSPVVMAGSPLPKHCYRRCPLQRPRVANYGGRRNSPALVGVRRARADSAILKIHRSLPPPLSLSLSFSLSLSMQRVDQCTCAGCARCVQHLVYIVGCL